MTTPRWVPSLFMEGAELGQSMFEGLSPQQKKVSNDRLMAAAVSDPVGFASAGAIQALKTDVGRVGKRAFQKPFEKPRPKN